MQLRGLVNTATKGTSLLGHWRSLVSSRFVRGLRLSALRLSAAGPVLRRPGAFLLLSYYAVAYWYRAAWAGFTTGSRMVPFGSRPIL